MVTADFFPDTFGGVDRVVFEASKGLAERGHRVSVTARRVRPELPMRETMAGFRVFRFPILRQPLPAFQMSEALGAWLAARDVLKEGPVDIVHVHEALPGVLASAMTRHRALPLVYSFYAPWGEEWRGAFLARRPIFGRGPMKVAPTLFSAYLRAIEKRSLRRASKIVVLSEFTRDILLQDYAVRQEDTVRIPAGVDAECFRPAADRAAVRRELGIGQDALMLLTVRRLVPRMGIENLLGALALLKKEVPNVKLFVGGTGHLREQLESVAGTMGLGENVRFLGAIPDDALPRYYQAADLFVLPTLALEGFGLVTLEALACGTPVVGTPAGATPEILTPLDPRLVAGDTSAGAMAEAVRGALRAGLLAAPMRGKCRAHVEKNYSWRRFAERHEQVYLDCAK